MIATTLSHHLGATACTGRARFALALAMMAGMLCAAPVKAQLLEPEAVQQPVVVQADRPFRGLHRRVVTPGGVHRNSTPTCSKPSLSYYGGPVVSNVQVVVVYWNSGVNATAQANLPQFYRDLTNSAYFDLLSEYSTDVTVTGTGTATNQSIGRGSYVGAYTITPTKCADPTAKSCSLTDAQLQTEIEAQINAGVLPAPEYDSNGNAETAYMVYFPANISLSAPGGSGTSCVQFCAYHGTATFQTKPLLYGAIMDTFTAACNSGCGDSANAFDNLTYDSSHELAEAVTDADVGLFSGSGIGPPVAWYSNSCGEIADICADGKNSTITVGQDSLSVSAQWSNNFNECIVSGLHPSITLTSSDTAIAGTPFNFTVKATNPAGKKGTDTAFASTLHFTSDTDTNATLPADYTFKPADAGVATFQATLHSGAQTITATDTTNSAITASGSFPVTASVQVNVGPNVGALSFSVDGTSYTGAQLFTWAVGSSHTLATTSPQISPSGAVEYTFQNWSDSGALSHTVTAASNVLNYTVFFNKSYLLTTAASPAAGGSVTPTPGSFFPTGSVQNVTATANTGYNFTGWTGPVADASSASTTVTMSDPVSVTANFAVANVNVTIATTPAGLPVSVDGGVALNSPLNVQWQVGSQHTIATASPQGGAAGTQYRFVSWSDAGAISHTVTAAQNVTSYTATFGTYYLLTTGVSPVGGGVITPVSGSYFLANSAVNLTAKANAGYIFSSWTGKVANAKAAATTVAMAAAESVTANFLKIEPTTTALKSSANPATFGQAVTFTATVAVKGGATPAGTVTFKNGATVLKTVALTGSSASYLTSTLAVGTATITATYNGDPTAKASTSAALKQVVNKDASTTMLIASANPALFGQIVKLTATVKSTGKVSGTVTFNSGATVLGKVTLTGNTAILSTAALAAGTHAITATFSGNTTVNGSTSAALNLTVNKAATTTTLSSSKNPSTTGQAVTFTATVISTAGNPTGTVTFKSGTTTLGSVALTGGVTKFTTSKLAKGTDSITASYGGAVNYKPSTATLKQVED